MTGDRPGEGAGSATRVVVFGGWFGSRNAGDEAILVALRDLLREAIPGCEVRAHTIDPEYTRRVCGVEPVFAPPERSFFGKAAALARAYRSADLFLVSGGTPIFDYRYGSHAFHFGVPLLSGVPMVFFGIGTKPIASRFGRWFYRTLLERAHAVSVRDPGVRDHLREIGVARELELTADSAICAPVGGEASAERALLDAGLDPGAPIAGLCPIYLSDDHRAHYHTPVPAARRRAASEHLARLADHLVDNGIQVAFVPMHRVEPDDDREVIRAIRERMHRPSAVVLPEEDPRHVLALLGRLDLVVGMRLHSLVLASARAVPVVGISFDPKVETYMRYLGMERYCVDIHDFSYEDLLATTEACWARRAEIRSELGDTMERWRGLVAHSAATLANAAERPGGSESPARRAGGFARRQARRAAKYARQRRRPAGGASPLFVLGCQRSGTTMLLDVLDASPDTWIYHEQNRRAFRRDWHVRSREVRARLVAAARCRWVVFKPLYDSQRADTLLADHPDARALWVVRDWRGVARSSARKWGERLPLVIRRLASEGDCDHWMADRLPQERRALLAELQGEPLSVEAAGALRWYLRNAHFFDLDLGARSDRVRPLRYEDLAERPRETFERLFGYLGLAFEPAFVAGVRPGRARARDPLAVPRRIEDLCEQLASHLDAACDAAWSPP